MSDYQTLFGTAVVKAPEPVLTLHDRFIKSAIRVIEHQPETVPKQANSDAAAKLEGMSIEELQKRLLESEQRLNVSEAENRELRKAFNTIDRLGERGKADGYTATDIVVGTNLIIRVTRHTLQGKEGPLEINGGRSGVARGLGLSNKAVSDSLNKYQAVGLVEIEEQKQGYNEEKEPIKPGQPAASWGTLSTLRVVTIPALLPELEATGSQKAQRQSKHSQRKQAQRDARRVKELEAAICPHCYQQGILHAVCSGCGTMVEAEDYEPIITGQVLIPPPMPPLPPVVDSTTGSPGGVVDSTTGSLQGVVDSTTGSLQGVVDSTTGSLQGVVDSTSLDLGGVVESTCDNNVLVVDSTTGGTKPSLGSINDTDTDFPSRRGVTPPRERSA